MLNYTVSPMGLRFPAAPVQGSLPSLYATPQTLSFKLYNNTLSSIILTGYGFTNSTDGDAVTQPSGQIPNSDFTVAVHSASFPVTITAGSNQQFDVTYAPLRRGSGFGDIRSQMLMFYQGNKALSNGG